MRVLIVDDSSGMRMVIRNVLEATGWVQSFFEAEDGIDAETCLQEQHLMGEPIDLVITDWHMPRMTGLELVQRLKQIEAFRQGPMFIMLSAETYEHQIELCRQNGVDFYLTKPFEAKQLRQAVEHVLRGQGGVRHAV